MLKRFTNTQLAIALGVLGVLYLSSFVLSRNGDRTFKKEIAVIDTAKVDQILVQSSNNGKVTLKKANSIWQVEREDGQTFLASSSTVKAALNQLSALTATQLVSTNADEYSGYQVDSSGTTISVYQDGKVVYEGIIGRNEFQQTGISTYVRTEGEKEVYAVQGSLGNAINKSANDWRDKTLIKGNTSTWSKLTFSYPEDSSFQIVLSGSEWKLPDSTSLNSSQVRTYLNTISNLDGSKIVDASPGIPSTALFSLVIEGEGEPIRVYAYPDSGEEYILTSNLNESAFFSGKDGNLWKRIFVSISKFLPTEEA